MKKLKNPEIATAKFFTVVEVLDAALGPDLFQLPPNWRADAARLDVGCDVYCFFDNDQEACSPHDAARPREML